MAQVIGKTPRMEAKRTLDEGVRKWDKGNASIPEATVHSCVLGRSPSTEDVANGSFEMSKRSRMETAGPGEMISIPVRPYRDTSRWFTGEPAARAVPLHREHGTPFCQCGGSNRPRGINVPIEMVSAGGGVAGGGAAGEGAVGEGAAGGGISGRGAAGGDAVGAGAARGGAADERFSYGVIVRNEINDGMSVNCTADFIRSLGDRKLTITQSKESGGKIHLTLQCNQ